MALLLVVWINGYSIFWGSIDSLLLKEWREMRSWWICWRRPTSMTSPCSSNLDGPSWDLIKMWGLLMKWRSKKTPTWRKWHCARVPPLPPATLSTAAALSPHTLGGRDPQSKAFFRTAVNQKAHEWMLFELTCYKTHKFVYHYRPYIHTSYQPFKMHACMNLLWIFLRWRGSLKNLSESSISSLMYLFSLVSQTKHTYIHTLHT